MKLLKIEQYQDYTIEIYGRYSESAYQGVTVDGVFHGGSVSTMYKIKSIGGLEVRQRTFLNENYCAWGCDENEGLKKFVAVNRIVKEGKIFRKTTRHITLKEDLERVIKDLILCCTNYIDRMISNQERLKRENEITNGLMDSLDSL